MSSPKLVLSAADYAIVLATLSVSSGIGVYFQFANKRKTNEEYLFAGKDMSIFPVAFSLMATFMSATTLMGIPAEMYLYGTNMAFMNVGFILGPIIAAYVFLPIFFANDVSTAYEYLELRFGKTTRRVVSAVFAVQLGLFTSATLYAPALALSAVTNLSLWVSIITIGVVCTFYSTLGGMKAVLWTDVFQATLMYMGLIAIIVIGCLKLGGVDNVFKIANEGGRLIVPRINLSFEDHYTMLNVLAQTMIITISAYGGTQIQVQRLLAVKNLKRSQIASIVSAPMLVVFHLMCCFCGIIFYAYFKNCDPITAPNKPIQSPDQLMPYFIATAMKEYPGLPGLCITGIFCASLSTVSSSVNSLAAVTAEDLLRPIFPNSMKSVLWTKFISFLYGAVCIGFSFVIASMGNLIKITILIYGMIAGPTLAVFILAACTTSTNEQGLLLGLVSGLALAAILSFVPTSRTDPFLPLSNECPLLEQSTTEVFSSTTSPISLLNGTHTSSPIITNADENFHLAYMWISSLALLTCLVVGYFGSIAITLIRGKYTEVPEIHLSPVRIWFSRRLSMAKQRALQENEKKKEKPGGFATELTPIKEINGQAKTYRRHSIQVTHTLSKII